MPDTSYLLFNTPGLRSTSLIRSLTDDAVGTSGFQQVDRSLLVNTALGNSASFKYDLDGNGIKSTQQLNVDWSEFSNHTFFNSAQVKTNVAFDKIFNQFPFDGTQSELELYLDSLTGFEKYVYDQWPKNTGYLFFSGTAVSESSGGTYVTVKDQAGTNAPYVSRKLTAESFLNPVSKSMTIEMQLFIPSGSNVNQYILNKLTSQNQGFVIGVNATGSVSVCKLGMAIVSGTNNAIGMDISNVQKGQWNHLAFIWDRTPGVNRLFGYLNHVLVQSSSQLELGYLDMDSADLIIGSGSANPLFTPTTTFSGAIDELRIWHRIPSGDERKQNEKKAIFAQDNLQLYFKFNEPSGSMSRIVLDSSSNSLHGMLSLSGYNLGVREVPTGSVAGPSPMTYEKISLSPVLFPEYPGIETLQTSLLMSASIFDEANPNLITKLIPKHYLLEGQFQDGLTTEEGNIVNPTTATSTDPQSTQLGNTQVLLLLLYTWAKFFDEMKLYIQAFADLNHLDYDSTDTVPDKFLQFYADRFGFKLPPMFTGASIPQFIDAENIDNTISTNEFSLQYVQNQIWRRILINLKDVVQSKGTIHSVKSFIRSVGIDPDNNFRIREFGGPTKKSLTTARENHTKTSTFIDFTSGGLVQSPYLSGTRTEPGNPPLSGNALVAGPNDGLFTSGSWTFEGLYRFPTTASLAVTTTQSLARLMVTGSAHPNPGLVIGNLVAVRTQGLLLYMNAGTSAGQDVVLSLPVDILDGDNWYISFGVQRADYITSSVSSSVFLRVGKQSAGTLLSVMSSSGYTNPYALYSPPNFINFWSELSSTENPSGSFLQVGNDPRIGPSNSGFYTTDSASFGSTFNGYAGHLRFWSKYLSENEWREHIRNFESLGVDDPTTNFNFVTNKTGSWERLRMDITSDQVELASDNNGFLQLTDFSQNNLHWSGSFAITSSVIVPQKFQYSLISPKFDVGSTTDKVRIRSFLSYDNVLSSSYAEVAPAYEVPKTDLPQDNTRFTIDFSIVDALDQDIVNIFSTLDALDNILGDPTLVFSPDYPKLENLRDIYFNRLTSKMNIKSFFDFYKWFDTNVGVFISQLIPRKTKFLGTNFVIESHMLERPKMEYLYSDIYLGDSDRHSQKDTILLQQFVGTIHRY